MFAVTNCFYKANKITEYLKTIKTMIIQSYKVYEDYIEFNIEQAENTKITKRRKTSFRKE